MNNLPRTVKYEKRGSLAIMNIPDIGRHGGRVGSAARGVSTLFALALLATGIQVGHRGGILVYEHGAAAAYAGRSTEPNFVHASQAGGLQELAPHHEGYDDDQDGD